ncbi:MAG: hypothetical protein K2X82_04560 [Gemmataceae bacterium]|nr:hypothetical protein [Gemmataceae bacterium]
MRAADDLRPRAPVEIANLYDVVLGGGDSAVCPSRGVMVLDAIIDPEVFSVTLPPSLVQQLRLTTATGTPGRLSPVRIWIGGRSCPADVFPATGDEWVTVGRLPLLALGLIVGPDGHLIDDPHPDRCGPPPY